ncbi:MAG TPA: FAD/NAD(P)-binding protein [Solirubrobacteraceae bacterium]|jgi:phytoene dehydrogenase-like protein
MRVAVIGAGVAGLTAAARLAEQGLAVTVLDQGRRPGGHLATRELAGARADHGAASPPPRP